MPPATNPSALNARHARNTNGAATSISSASGQAITNKVPSANSTNRSFSILVNLQPRTSRYEFEARKFPRKRRGRRPAWRGLRPRAGLRAVKRSAPAVSRTSFRRNCGSRPFQHGISVPRVRRPRPVARRGLVQAGYGLTGALNPMYKGTARRRTASLVE